MSRFRSSRRDATQVVGPDSSSLSYSPQSGAWTPAPLGSGSCATSAEQTITPGSSVTFRFTGTDVTVNVLKNTNGAPYNVTLDGQVSQFNAYSTSEQCTADFRATNLRATEHTVIITHDGSSSLAASGRSTLDFVSFQFSGNAGTAASSPSSKSSTPVGAIVGGIIGALAVIILVAAIVWYCRRRRRGVVEQDRSFSPRKDEVIREPYNNSSLSPYTVPGSGSDTHPSSSTDPLAGTTLIPQRRTKATEVANNNNRYIHSSPWASLTSQNRSRQNMGDDANNNAAYSGYTSSVVQSGAHSYPPGSATEVTDDPEDSNSASPRIGSFSPNQSRPSHPSHQTPGSIQRSSSHHHVPAPAPPSTVGESVLIDDPDYIPPPSYSPGPSNLPRQTSLMQRSKAAYEGTSSNSSRAFSPASSQRPLPHNPSQQLSQQEVDVIARRVVDLLRSGSSVGGSSVVGSGVGSGTGSEISMSSNEVANPQVQQAIKALLGKEGSEPTSSGNPEKS